MNNDTFKSFEYKGKLLGNTEADRTNGILKKVKIAFPLKYLVIFSRSFWMPLVNCEIETIVKWTDMCLVYNCCW